MLQLCQNICLPLGALFFGLSTCPPKCLCTCLYIIYYVYIYIFFSSSLQCVYIYIYICVYIFRYLHFQLISSVDPKFLKLTKLDDEIYSDFRGTFKDLDVKRLTTEDLKSEGAKEVRPGLRGWDLVLKRWNHRRVLKGPPGLFRFLLMFQVWRPFCNRFEGLVEDFNYGTLLRLDAERDYSEENSIFGLLVSHCSSSTTTTTFVSPATRVQFFAVEVARNREGSNDTVFLSQKSKS